MREIHRGRGFQIAVSSDPIALASNTFDASAVTVAVPDSAEAVVDYRANGPLVQGGRRALAAPGAANSAADGALSFALETQLLAMPLDVALPSVALPGGDTTFRLTGTLVAVRGMILRPVLLQITSPQTPGQMTLVWSTTFKLQKATSLALQDWTDYSASGMETITLGPGAAFFRVTL